MSASTTEPAPVVWDAAAPVAERMTAAANGFVDLLDAAARRVALHPFAGEARRDWGYTPRRRPGLPLRAMSDVQRRAAWALIDAGLSAEGSAKTRGVQALEAMLQATATDKAYRDPENYALALFGRPGPEPWGWRFEGHHVSLTFTLVPGVGMAVTPHFFGANPFSGRVLEDPAHGGLAGVLDRESVLAFEIVQGLDPKALAQATIAAASPADILTGPGRELSLREPVGLPLEAMPTGLRQRTTALVEVFFGHLARELAQPLMARLRGSGLGGLRFAWAGATTPDGLHYYRLHGPTLLIEYDRTERDHAHAVWHDPTNPFGEDHLRRHRREAHQHGGVSR